MEINMATIRFSSGEVFNSESAATVYEAAQSLGIISREVLAAKVNGEPPSSPTLSRVRLTLLCSHTVTMRAQECSVILRRTLWRRR